MLNNELKFNIRSPQDDKEFEQYYYLRWDILRKQFNPLVDSAKDDLENKSHHLIAITNKAKIIGVGRIHFIDKNNAQIRYMAVSNQFRNNNVGQKLLFNLIGIAKLHKIKKIFLHSREEAVNFYSNNGFILKNKSHLLFKTIQHYLMEKDLV